MILIIRYHKRNGAEWGRGGFEAGGNQDFQLLFFRRTGMI
jgi:hypothetical protein